MQIVSGKLNTPERVVIYGPGGVGKTSLASKMPNPLFIDVEHSTDSMDVFRVPTPTSWAMIMQTIGDLRRDPMGFKTIILDTADWAERLCTTELVAGKKFDGIEGFGYGKGYVYLAEKFGQLLNALTDLSEAHGINVVLNAHAAMRRVELPEETGAYDRWEMKLTRHVSSLVKEWATIVLFCNYKTIVVIKDPEAKIKTGKAFGGDRVMYTTHSVSWDAKNRHGLAPELPMGNSPEEAYAQIAHVFKRKAVVPAVAPVPAPTLPPATSTSPHVISTPPTATSTPLGRLRDLMMQANVTDKQLMKAVAYCNYYPENTPLEYIDPDFVEGRLIANWPAVLETINQLNGAKSNA